MIVAPFEVVDGNAVVPTMPRIYCAELRLWRSVPYAYGRVYGVLLDHLIGDSYAEILQWLEVYEFDASYIEEQDAIFFARDEDRTMFILRWADQK